ncbi:MAG TPA: hypothetical protein VL133_04320, partial [Devosia sp.]|nr:hypothetical protein [Devosia sp.]
MTLTTNEIAGGHKPLLAPTPHKRAGWSNGSRVLGEMGKNSHRPLKRALLPVKSAGVRYQESVFMHLLLVDGSTYIFRAYHALPPLTRKSDGLPVGCVSGFCNMLFKLTEDM